MISTQVSPEQRLVLTGETGEKPSVAGVATVGAPAAWAAPVDATTAPDAPVVEAPVEAPSEEEKEVLDELLREAVAEVWEEANDGIPRQRKLEALVIELKAHKAAPAPREIEDIFDDFRRLELVVAGLPKKLWSLVDEVVPARSSPPSYPPLQARDHLAYDAFGYRRHFYKARMESANIFPEYGAETPNAPDAFSTTIRWHHFLTKDTQTSSMDSGSDKEP